MADYTISTNAAGTSVTFKVTGLSKGDELWFWLRYDPDPGSMLVSEGKTAADGTYTISYTITPGLSYACNVAVNGTRLGAKTFTAGSGTKRPANWEWSGIYSGAPYENLNALQWNRFSDRINEFRAYKGLTAYPFTEAVSGVTLLSTLFSESRSAINDIPGHGTVPTVLYLSATSLNQLAAALNAVQ